jgi:hypothetical protein
MNSQVSSQRSEAEDHGGDTIGAATVVAVKPPSSGCDGEERHRAHGRAAKHNTWGRRRGCRLAIQPTRRRRYHRKHREAGRSSSEASRSRSSLEGKIHWAKLGGDGDEWRRGRQIPTVRWKHSTRQNDCPIGRRRSSSELAGIGRGSRRRFGIARED